LELDDIIMDTYVQFLQVQNKGGIRTTAATIIPGIARRVICHWVRGEKRFPATIDQPAWEPDKHSLEVDETRGWPATITLAILRFLSGKPVNQVWEAQDGATPSAELLEQVRNVLTPRTKGLFDYINKNEGFSHSAAARDLGMTVHASHEAMHRIKQAFRFIQHERENAAHLLVLAGDGLDPAMHEFLLDTAVTPIERHHYRLMLVEMLNQQNLGVAEGFKDFDVRLSYEVLRHCVIVTQARTAGDPLLIHRNCSAIWQAAQRLAQSTGDKFFEELRWAALICAASTAYVAFPPEEAYRRFGELAIEAVWMVGLEEASFFQAVDESLGDGAARKAFRHRWRFS